MCSIAGDGELTSALCSQMHSHACRVPRKRVLGSGSGLGGGHAEHSGPRGAKDIRKRSLQHHDDTISDMLKPPALASYSAEQHKPLDVLLLIQLQHEPLPPVYVDGEIRLTIRGYCMLRP